MNTGEAEQTPKSVAVLSSHVVRGTVGNRAAAHAIEALGHPAWSVPTVLLPWHPGQGAGTRLDWGDAGFIDLIGDLTGSEKLGEVGAVLSGYLGSEAQAEAIAMFIAAARERGAIYCCDPVIGNAGGRYVPEPLAVAIRDRLLPLADIATPNRFELGWVTGERISTPEDAVRVARSLQAPTVLVTSAEVSDTEITTLLITPDQAFAARHERVQAPNNGTGDLTAALFLARTLEGEPPENALTAALAGALEAMKAEHAAGADELPLERIHERLKAPSEAIDLRIVS